MNTFRPFLLSGVVLSVLSFACPLQAQSPHVPRDRDLVIATPREGTRVHEGEVVHVDIRLEGFFSKPQALYIITPHYLFEDREINRGYDLRIPRDQEPGEFLVIVMAKWEGPGGVHTISQAVTLIVESLQEKCARDCRQQGRDEVGENVPGGF